MCKMKLIAAIAAFTVLSISILAQAEYYYVMAYGAANDQGRRSVYLKMIDLDSAIIKDSMLVANGGIPSDGHPIQLNIDGQILLMAFVADGFADRNAVLGNSQIIYNIIKANNYLTLVKADTFMDCFSGWPRQNLEDNYFEFSIECNKTDPPLLEWGKYTIDGQYNFVKIDTSKIQREVIDTSITNHFRFIRRLNLPNKHNLYCKSDTGGYWILRLNSDNSSIEDSLLFKATRKTLDFLAYHPITDKLYILKLNFEYHVEDPGFKKYHGDDWITPEVYIFNPISLELIERDSIADSPKYLSFGPAIEYRADVVGNYIVAYPFYCELRESFLPAMLFIFDTRTNTARWLNVGWR